METSRLVPEIAALKQEMIGLNNPNLSKKKIELSRMNSIPCETRSIALTPLVERQCNICEYYGFFETQNTRVDALCPKCGSLERQRLLLLQMQKGAIPKLDDDNAKVLHFAPERILEGIFRQFFKHYTTADLFQRADLSLNMEEIEIESGSYDAVIANHVLEHVDDLKASVELSRILKDNGVLVCTVPIIEGLDETYENEAITSERDRLLHYGQSDHLRLYGKDFRERIASGGFVLEHEFTAQGEDVVNYALMAGEKVFVFRKI